jgi:hypothetical protein
MTFLKSESLMTCVNIGFPVWIYFFNEYNGRGTLPDGYIYSEGAINFCSWHVICLHDTKYG